MTSRIRATTWSWLAIRMGSTVCVSIPFQALLARLTPHPQYGQVITISPTWGEMGAPQSGHFGEVAPEGARKDAVGAAGCTEATAAGLVPHSGQDTTIAPQNHPLAARVNLGVLTPARADPRPSVPPPS